jgi:ethanolaminephosphotransferase
MTKYLSDKALANLRSYKYSAIDNSLSSRFIFNHVWNYLLTLVPLSIAPNALTLYGLLFTVFSWAICYVDLFEKYRHTPVAFLFYAACIWMYIALDALDGKQARRTGTSSPLGQLFDHGCDSISLVLVFFVMRVIYGFPLSYPYYALGALSFLVFVMGTWAEYYTNTLHLGIISGPVEGAIGLIVSSLLSAYHGTFVSSTL